MANASSIGIIRIPHWKLANSRQRLSVVIIITLIVADCLSGLLFNLGFSFHRVGIVVKSIVITFSLLFYLPLIRKRSFLSIYLTMIVLLVVWLIAAVTSAYWNGAFSFQYSLVVLNRYFFLFILAVVFIYASWREGFDRNCREILNVFFIANNTMIVLGFIFGIQWLSSFDPQNIYAGDSRFGYKGLIFGQNEVAGIYALGLAYYCRQIFKYGERKYILFFFTVIAAILTGAKASFLAVFLIGGYYFFRYRLKLLLLLVIPATLGVSYLVIKYWDLIVARYLSKTVELFQQLDFLSFITSGRNVYLENNFQFMTTYWMWLNWIFGDAFLYSETDFFDLYYFFGIGSLLYFFMYVKLFFYRDKSPDNLYFFLVFMALAFIAGHVLQSAIVPLFTLLFIFSVPPRPGANVPKTADPV